MTDWTKLLKGIIKGKKLVKEIEDGIPDKVLVIKKNGNQKIFFELEVINMGHIDDARKQRLLEWQYRKVISPKKHKKKI